MHRLSFASAVVLFAIPLSSDASLAADCKGDTRQEHHVGNFNFITGSWVEKVGNRRRYVSCVVNLDSGTDLFVNWLVAGPFRQYVPAGEVVRSPRLSDDPHPRPVGGCIEYGQLNSWTDAQFLGTAEDEKTSRDPSTCSHQTIEAGVDSTSGLDLPAQAWVDDVHMFFPSNPDNPHDTLMEISGQIGFQPRVDGYESFFEYTAKRYEGRENGSAQGIFLTPYFPNETKAFEEAYFASNKEIQPLGQSGTIKFTVNGESTQNWHSVPAFYVFKDAKGRVLSAIFLPLLRAVNR